MIQDLQPYPAYRPSGVEWLGDVPAHWEVRRLRNVVELRVSNVDKHSKDNELSVRLCNYVDVYKNDRITADIAFMRATATAAEIERFRLEAEDVLITKDSEVWNDIGVPALVEHESNDLVCGYHVGILRPIRKTLNGAYLFRSLQSPNVSCHFHVTANGVTRYGLTRGAIKSVRIPVPPLAEQAAIVVYLDHVDRHVQRYIDTKEKLITLLQEKRQALIHFCVTRGLNPDVPLKPSGVDWLGDVPAHWEVVQLGRIGRFSKGSGGTKADEVPEGIPCIRYGDLYTSHRFHIRASRSCVSETDALNYTPLRYGDILFAGSGETIEEIGKSAANLIEQSACCGGDVILFRPERDVDPVFSGYAFDCPQSQYQKSTMGRGFTVMHIYGRELKYLWIALPPLAEQRAIAAHLDQATATIGAAIDNARRQSERMAEYRASLIAHVVTGKLDVRAAVDDFTGRVG